MSTYYTYYTEAKVNGEMKWIDPVYPDKDGKNRKICSIWGQSWMGETANKLEELGRRATKEILSRELGNYLYKHYNPDAEDPWERYEPIVYLLDYAKIKELLLKNGGYEHHAYVTHDYAAKWRTDEIADIYEWLSPQEYHKLSDEEKRAYEYLEWDDIDGWVNGFKEIDKVVSVRLRDLDESDYSLKIESPRVILEIS